MVGIFHLENNRFLLICFMIFFSFHLCEDCGEAEDEDDDGDDCDGAANEDDSSSKHDMT